MGALRDIEIPKARHMRVSKGSIIPSSQSLADVKYGLPSSSYFLRIGAFIAHNPHYNILFGPVSISKNYHTVTRNLISFNLDREFSDVVDGERHSPSSSKTDRPRGGLTVTGNTAG